MKPLSEEKSYNFADFIRFVAMCAIIFQHSFLVDKEILLTDQTSLIAFYFLKTLAKIGSISFFLVSGFLLADALERYSSGEYVNKRLRNILRPYALFAAFYLLLDVGGAVIGTQKLTSPDQLPGFVLSKIFHLLFFTSYWFIFNYFISLAVLLLLRKYLYDLRLGLILFSCTLIYGVNVHLEWFAPHHTAAFTGFTFFLWLGANIEKSKNAFWAFIHTTPTWKLLAVAVVSLSLNLAETYYLIGTHAVVVDNSLKIANILYAVSVFLLLCKVGNGVRFTFLHPRDETYPLYLVHPIFLKVINYAMLPALPLVGSALTLDDPSELGWLAILLYQVGWFVFIYTLSLVAVRIILNSPLQWVFGKQGKVILSPAWYFRYILNEVRNLRIK